MLLKIEFSATKTYGKPTFSSTCLPRGCGGCDNWCCSCLSNYFFHPEFFCTLGNMRSVFIERYEKREGVIVVPLLLSKEGFLVMTHRASFTPYSNQFLSD